ncbi:ATP-binding cassette domain-containing protein [Hamadaea tsunoensis]|uniref:ATP-binding cassette domain-containing protein n=1 Tax=Hamadaea tsunoensis TaxID=53368 RepID=UPI000404A3A8|nr:ATP-binding cassette domain-containing protein [Hamadaea tsunoensis]
MLEISAIDVGYGRSTVLHGLTLGVPGEGITAVLGHNGAGKSTLLRAAAGLLKPKRGSVRLFGEDITRLAPHERVRRGMAYVPQGQQCFPHLTTMENLRLIADGRRDGAAALADALDLFPALVPLAKRRAGLLSGGQRQQLALARALITRPRLLLLDEPTEGIQPSVVAEIEQKIVALGSSIAILLVEQHLRFVLSAAQRYHVLAAGRITASGDADPATETTVRAALAV